MFQPEDLLYFIELDEFYEDWKTLGLDDDDLFVLPNGDYGKSEGRGFNCRYGRIAEVAIFVGKTAYRQKRRLASLLCLF